MATFLKKLNLLVAVSVCLAMATAWSSVAHAQGPKNLVQNGDFASSKFWKIENAAIKEGVLSLNNNGRVDPKAHYELSDLVPGYTYIVTADYRPGRAINLHAKVGDHFFKISVGNATREYTLLDATHKWNQLFLEFKADKRTATLTFEGEIRGKDADVDIDNVRVVQVEQTKYRLRAYEIKGAPGDKVNYNVVPGEKGTQAAAKDASKGVSGATFELTEVGDGFALKLVTNKPDGGLFLTATDDGNKVKFIEANDNNIPDGAVFKVSKPGLFKNAGAQSLSLESRKFPGKYLRHFQFLLVVNNSKEEARNTPENYQRDATWVLDRVAGSGQ